MLSEQFAKMFLACRLLAPIDLGVNKQQATQTLYVEVK